MNHLHFGLGTDLFPSTRGRTNERRSPEPTKVVQRAPAGFLVSTEETSKSLVGTEEIVQTLDKVAISSVSPRKRPRAQPAREQFVTYDFLGDDDRLRLVPLEAIPDPPSRSYQSREELEELIRDWEHGKTLIVNGCFIPLQHWQALYKGHRPNAWGVVKGYWSQWRVLIEPRPPLRESPRC
jgi:hypothetical protein